MIQKKCFVCKGKGQKKGRIKNKRKSPRNYEYAECDICKGTKWISYPHVE